MNDEFWLLALNLVLQVPKQNLQYAEKKRVNKEQSLVIKVFFFIILLILWQYEKKGVRK